MPEERPPISEHEYEDQLEPTHLIRRSHVVLRAGGFLNPGDKVKPTMATPATAG